MGVLSLAFIPVGALAKPAARGHYWYSLRSYSHTANVEQTTDQHLIEFPDALFSVMCQWLTIVGRLMAIFQLQY